MKASNRVLLTATTLFLISACAADDGAAVGQYMDRQQQKLEQKLARERRDEQIAVTRIDDETLRLDIRSAASFAVNSSSLSPGFQSSLDTMAEIINEFDKTAVHVIGHTDSSGAQNYNQSLSQKRAGSVARQLINKGITKRRIRAMGKGENEPRFDNRTEEGRNMNRRVEVYLKTIVEGRENQAYRTPVSVR
jgi:outer membrane protein OmpA-like peptidoglycan-associated protein